MTQCEGNLWREDGGRGSDGYRKEAHVGQSIDAGVQIHISGKVIDDQIGSAPATMTASLQPVTSPTAEAAKSWHKFRMTLQQRRKVKFERHSQEGVNTDLPTQIDTQNLTTEISTPPSVCLSAVANQPAASPISISSASTLVAGLEVSITSLQTRSIVNIQDASNQRRSPCCNKCGKRKRPGLVVKLNRPAETSFKIDSGVAKVKSPAVGSILEESDMGVPSIFSGQVCLSPTIQSLQQSTILSIDIPSASASHFNESSNTGIEVDAGGVWCETPGLRDESVMTDYGSKPDEKPDKITFPETEKLEQIIRDMQQLLHSARASSISSNFTNIDFIEPPKPSELV